MFVDEKWGDYHFELPGTSQSSTDEEHIEFPIVASSGNHSVNMEYIGGARDRVSGGIQQERSCDNSVHSRKLNLTKELL
jgi:hypothetical protein